ncbi:BON domain-containing protein [Suttonella sp. R2A3]|uniref:BON domain-containing protein n=1 Tax=Suttonella sp. R2A3 TaxID=2908648 RepID=UPI001F39FAC4|nr:BON domain-containing protein [Suttonella sp. R2A3]UJF24443.1 BON domain-containing protein [Suttonella sp. R2A3]
MKRTYRVLITVLVALVLQGCGVLFVGGAATTAGVVHDRRTAGTIVDDNALELKIRNSIGKQAELYDNSHVNVTGYNGRILLTGEANSQATADAIGQLAARHLGVKEVINQIIVGRASTFMERSYDAKQTLKVKTVLFDVNVPGFDPSRVKVVTEHGVSFLMGIVSEAEAQAVAERARRVSGVRQIATLFEIR